MSVTLELRFGQDEEPPNNDACSLDADYELFGMVQVQFEINMNLCLLLFNTLNVFH